MKYIQVLVALFLLPWTSFSESAFVITPEMEQWALNQMLSEENALPLQAGISDIVGIGHITNSWDTGFTVAVDNYWIGNPGSNSLSIVGRDIPVTNTPVLFFATEYVLDGRIEPATRWYQFVFDSAWLRDHSHKENLRLVGHTYSLIPVTTDNAELVSFASNLVYAAQVPVNTNAFYKTIRDGVRLHPPSSRIHTDSMMAFRNCGYFMSTNFIHQIQSDPLLGGEAKTWVDINLEALTWHPKISE